MAKMKENINELLNIEKEFYDFDEEKKEINFKLEFSEPEEIFDKNSITKVPVLSDEFFSWIQSSLEYTPNDYKLNIDIKFDDMKGYNEQQLKEIFNKNLGLEFKKNHRQKKSKDLIAYGLIAIGIVSLISMLLITWLWTQESLFREIVTYVLDIATTVVIWEAMTMLLVENKERRSYLKNILIRFGNISFGEKNK
ncbi:MAG: hypothetical protein MSH40_05525 [Christensenella sp.]|nr:hypothetical protein [Christensenella sp.]